MSSVYIFDTSAFIDMDKYYPIERDLAYWRHIDTSINSGNFRAPFLVFEDILTYDDDLKKWLEKRRKKMEIAPTDYQNRAVSRIESDYPKLCNYRAGRINADPFVIACALEMKESIPTTLIALDPIVVAQEGERKRVTIPQVCEKFGIECIMIDELWERENWVIK